MSSAVARRMARSALLLAWSLCTLVACASPYELGERAFKDERYDDALTHYGLAIEEGNRDPELFYKAAQASMRVGDLGAVERYYSRSIRYGGGIKVMRALAEYYIQTSNYARAAQVLHELLRVDPEQQMIYGNLGTALLYSGNYSESESLLVIAQQMDPEDPLPYLNLGILYERHLYSPARGVAFYTCYMELSDARAPQRTEVAQRIQELRARIGLDTVATLQIVCGEPYIAGDYNAIDNEARLERLRALKERSAREDIDLGLEASADAPETSVKIESGTPPAMDPQQQPRQADEAALRETYLKSRCDEVVARRQRIPLEAWSASALRMVADCHERLAQRDRAEQVWSHILGREPSPGDLLAMIELIDTPARRRDVEALCAAHASLLTLASLRERCALRE